MAEQIPTLATLLGDVSGRGGSDMHLIHGLPPISRISGEIGALPFPALTSDDIKTMLKPYISESQEQSFAKDMRVNCSHTIEGHRYRFSVYMALGTVGASIRVLPQKPSSFAALGLPPVVATLAQKKSGIIFITGATGSGKSTTMASMLEWINQGGRPGKIITIEDPVETIFKPCRCVFVQREVGLDTPSFSAGIIDSLRQDPDVLCIGELRDDKSIYAAIVAAETGHLVFTTLHTRDASKTVQRIVTAAGSDHQESLREQLSESLEAVISQELLPRADGKGQVVCCEVLVATSAVRQLIRENKLEQINDAIQSGSQAGMVSKDSCLKNHYLKGVITRETALAHMRNPDTLGR